MLRKQERSRAFKRSESSRKNRHKEIYGKEDDRSKPRDFLRNKRADFMQRRPDNQLTFEGSDWDINAKRSSKI